MRGTSFSAELWNQRHEDAIYSPPRLNGLIETTPGIWDFLNNDERRRAPIGQFIDPIIEKKTPFVKARLITIAEVMGNDAPKPLAIGTTRSGMHFGMEIGSRIIGRRVGVAVPDGGLFGDGKDLPDMYDSLVSRVGGYFDKNPTSWKLADWFVDKARRDGYSAEVAEVAVGATMLCIDEDLAIADIKTTVASFAEQIPPALPLQ